MTSVGGILQAANWQTRVGAALLVLSAGFAVAGSTSHAQPVGKLQRDRRLRDVRVLVATEVSRVRLSSADAIVARDDGKTAQARFSPDERIVLTAGSDGSIRSGNRLRVASIVSLEPENGGPLRLSFEKDGEWSQQREYPGSLRLRISDGGLLDAINLVDAERYVACVVANEVWPTFETEAYRAQAIAARSFVLYQMSRKPDADVDVTATQGSQVYKGIRSDTVGRRAAEAAEYTHGVVLVWKNEERYRLFCTYYSAACGGMSQSAALFGTDGEVPPLRGGVECDYCKIAPGDTYRWGPVSLPIGEITSRLTSRYPKLSSLGSIRSIEAIERTASGRPITLRITGSGGDTHEMLAERFRLAIDGMLIRSTDCRVRVRGDKVTFDNGKGFGHGLGLCQWGMEGQAQEGKRAGAILRYYYPGARLVRVY